MDFTLFNAMPLIASAEGGEEGHGIGLYIFVYSILAILVVLVFATLAKRGFTKRTFVGLPARLAEHLYLFLDGMAKNVVGPHGAKYVPILLAMWLFIFVANVFGLIFPYTPTADWSLNISLAVITVLYVQYEGIKANGVLGHFKHFAGPKLPGAMVAVSGLIFCVEIISELMKLVSLSIRLYGNIEGGHIVKEALNSIVTLPNGAGLPLGGLLLPIKLFTCLIQAFVFTILTCTYLSLVTSHEHDEEHEHGHAHGEAHTNQPSPAHS